MRKLADMLLSDVVPVNGKIYLKSEFGPMSSIWPAVSFSKASVGVRLRRDYRPSTDVIVYVGTSDPRTTREAAHRRRLLSAVKIEPNTIHETRDLIPAESWYRAQQDYKGRWGQSFDMLQAWELVGYPLAVDIVGSAYSELGQVKNFGNVIELETEPQRRIRALEIRELFIVRQKSAKAFDDKRAFLDLDAKTKAEIARLRNSLLERAARSGTKSTHTNPLRMVESNIDILLGRKLKEQGSCCALCDGKLEIDPENRLLKWSIDRIESSNDWYNEQNLHIVHMACNLAKNDASMHSFRDWLAVARGSGATDENTETKLD